MEFSFNLEIAPCYGAIQKYCTLFRLTILTHPLRLQLHYSYVALNSKFLLIQKVVWIGEFELGGLHCNMNIALVLVSSMKHSGIAQHFYLPTQ